MKHDKRGQTAVTIAYGEPASPPRIVPSVQRAPAESIIASARKNGIYVHESAPLVALLMQLDMDAQIPHQLYAAVAELLAWLHEQEHGTPLAGNGE